MASNGTKHERTWVTLLTRSSYLPGVITLRYSLSTHDTAHTLVVLITPSLPESSLPALKPESTHNPLLKIHPIEPLLLPNNQKATLIASRFEDTWTKLRAFELTSYEACVFLDADITIYKNMDRIFDTSLLGDDRIVASHACVCSLFQDSWALKNWIRKNYTYALLNGGVFLYHPSEALWQAIHHHFLTSTELSAYQFPDQDFMTSFFRGKWLSLPWKYNALKTMKQWHTNFWRDDEVKGLHYIVGKPWEKRVASDAIGGHLGRDRETHTWWWRVWEEWRSQRQGELVEIMDNLVAKPLDGETDGRQCAENKTKGFPVPIPEQ